MEFELRHSPSSTDPAHRHDGSACEERYRDDDNVVGIHDYNFSRRDYHNDSVNSNINQQLPPADGGADAWLFLAACFMIEALVWGMTTPVNRRLLINISFILSDFDTN